MSFKPNIDLATLAWVSDEVRSSMDDAEEEIKRYKVTGDQLCLQACTNYLHQIGGTLQMVELDALGRFVEELEQLANSDQFGRQKKKACAALSEGIEEIGLALDRAETGLPEMPGYRMHLVNNTRSARGEGAISGIEFFVPRLDALPELPGGKALTEEQYIEAVQGERLRFQKALLTWLKDGGGDVLQAALKVAQSVLAISRFSYATRMWWVACAYLETLQGLGKGVAHQHRLILRRLDDLLRELSLHGESALLRDPEDELLRQMLFEIGGSAQRTPLADKVYRFYSLQSFFEEPIGAGTADDAPYDRAALMRLESSVVVELATIQQLLTRFFESEGLQEDLLDKLLSIFKDLTRAARKANVKPIARLSDALAQVLQKVANQELEATELLGLHLAAALLFVEQALSGRVIPDKRWEKRARSKTVQFLGLVDGQELGQVGKDEVSDLERVQLLEVVSSAVDQTLSELEQQLESFAQSPDNTDLVRSLPSHFDHVRGVLQILGEQRASLLLTKASETALHLIARRLEPSTLVIEALAVVVGAIEAYIGAMKSGRGGLQELVERSLADLERATGKVVTREDVEHLIGRSTSHLQRWLEQPTVLSSLTALRGDLRDMHALASSCGLARAIKLVSEVQGLLDVVEEDPVLLSPNVVSTLKASLARVAEEIIELYVDRDETAASGSEDVEALSEELRIHDSIEPDELGIDLEATEAASETPAGFVSTEDELRAIFVEEAKDILGEAAGHIERCLKDASDLQTLTEFRRVMHTIKGSGRTAGLQATGELAWLAESICNIVLDAGQAPSKTVLKFLKRVSDELAKLLAGDFKNEHKIDLTAWHSRADDLHERLLAGTDADAEYDQPEDEDRELRQVFVKEANEHISVIESWLAGQDDNTPVSQEVRLGIHTLLGNFRTLGLAAIAEILSDADDYVTSFHDRKQGLPKIGFEALAELVKDLRSLLDVVEDKAAIRTLTLPREASHQEAFRTLVLALPAAQPQLAVDQEAGRKIAELAEMVGSETETPQSLPDEVSALADVFCEEARSRLDKMQAHTESADWHTRAAVLKRLSDGWASIKALANSSGETEVAAFCAALQGYFGKDAKTLADYQPEAVFTKAAASLRQALADIEQGDGAGRLDSFDVDAIASPGGEEEVPGEVSDVPAHEAPVSDAGPDEELVRIFCQEAHDVLQAVNASLTGVDGDQWTATREALLRNLHTLKGSARMCGFEQIGQLAHSAEDLVDAHKALSEPGGRRMRALLEEVHDFVHSAIAQIEKQKLVDDSSALVASLKQATGSLEDKADQDADDSYVEVLSEAPRDDAEKAKTPRDEGPQPVGGRGALRIDYNVLDKLSDVITGTTVARAHMEEEAGGLKNLLVGLRERITLMTEQLDEFSLEVDAQIDAGAKQGEASDKKGDPLEMDRYSRLQQYPRLMAEELDGLRSLQAGLVSHINRIEDSLHSQVASQTEMQQEVMQIRLVPFAELVPQLRQVVRQTARQLGKQVELRVKGESIGIDRAVLDVLAPALEHLARNAIGHGIETAEARQAAGKPANGRLEITCEHIGRDIHLTVYDDGAGMDAEQITAKAFETGLVESATRLNSAQLVHVISSSGFSTAEAVTSVSGRGVGLDAVKHALHILGGSIELDTTPGQGSAFILRVPVSLAVTRVLFFSLGRRHYATAAHTVESVKQLTVEDFERLDGGEHFHMEHDREQYRLIDLRTYFGDQRKREVKTPLPVLMIRCGTQNIAVVVDQIGESREVMLRPFGTHLEQLSLFSGTTPASSGELALVVNFVGLSYLESDIHLEHMIASDDGVPLVMVVDDSLTVRKAAERDLVSLGIEPLLARDGYEAQQTILDRVPALILLDLEMPRMDGFDFLEWKAGQKALKDVPVAIISSRTREHYRQRAFDLGATDFLGKPYELDDLKALLEARLGIKPVVTKGTLADL